MTKAELMGYRHREREMRHLEQVIRELRERIESPVAAALTGMPKANGGIQDRVAENIARMEELLDRYNAIWDEKIDMQHRIENAIAQLEPTEQALVRMRYIDGMKWERICVELDYGWDSTHRKHREALENLAEKRSYTIVHPDVV